ncbi:MAG: class I SAM-dependent methyltransferase [Planctomycetota bacterium]
MPRSHLDPCELYRCPDTCAPLEWDGQGLRASLPWLAASVVYPVRRGVPDFSRAPASESPEVVARLQELNRRAARDGWRAALEVLADPEAVRYVTSPTRTAFLELLPLAGARALEVGASLGQITAAAARLARQVYALEVVPLQAAFALARCRQEGLDNVAVAGGGADCLLPYADGAFDVVILNLVLEWCAGRSGGDPEQLQRRLLHEALRVLMPGGTLWVATKNRFALRYLSGRGDEHAHGLPFGNALPRPLLRGLLRLRRLPPAPGLLRSHRGLAALLCEVGFERPRSLWAAPEVRYPRRFVSMRAAAVRAARRHPDFEVSLPLRLVPARLVKHLAHGLVFVARKPAWGAPRAPASRAASWLVGEEPQGSS